MSTSTQSAVVFITAIYGDDRATHLEGINEAADEDDETGHDLHDMDVSSTQPQASTAGKGENSSAKKMKKTNDGEPVSAEAIINAAMLLGGNIREVGKELSQSIGTEMKIQQRVEELDGALGEIEGLTEDERDDALSKIPDHPAQMLVFFSLVPSRRLGWVRRFLSRH
ncbi:hypothetical protein COLO4_25419 [Corchorus olitorius]|uniref:Uncharacterized protein n=1 Tax=Corchorus olitorius TaxID=93759 RepID=A0A1R3I332_9ROSI|nr:hypothetical protein COLO4_25419 [Corchorus olitorius]